MAYCTKCGNKLEEGVNSCAECGSNIDKTSSQPTYQNALDKLKQAKDKATDKLNEWEVDKKLKQAKDKATEKLNEWEVDKKLGALNDTVEKHAKIAVDKTKEVASATAEKVKEMELDQKIASAVSTTTEKIKDMELDKKIENSEFEKKTGIFKTAKRYKALVAVGLVVVVAIGIFAWGHGGNQNRDNGSGSTTRQTSNPTFTPTPTAKPNDLNKSDKPTTDSVTKVATDFEILSGSSNVCDISQRNFGLICDNCGYRNGTVGTGDIYRNLSKYTAGSIETVSGAMWCATAFKGGCGQRNDYTLRVRFE